ncbi:hypothetical protein RCG23_00785 [Neobacillus sp. PS3-34]|uniref:hypothetical protein n=1 Tax=Neobacillus sp. PS3-34 TaxID=3070678 RepID=UPI0027DF1F1C|nr:hypothetical protein [Neobacillus sp. PS3-34]WML48717.1 hypothetical protein RCG23_00785 [Neobacillus sp. PS3-34]
MTGKNSFFVVCVLTCLLFIISACGIASNGSSTNNKSQSDHSSQSKNASSNNSSRDVSSTTNNSNQNNKNSKSSNESTTKSNNSAGNQFGTTIDQAMQYLQMRSNVSHISLMAPTKPIFTPNVQYMGGKVSAAKDSYSVNLISTDKQLPINSPLLSSRKYDQMSNLIGGFGGTIYSSSKIAMAQLYNTPANDLAPAYQLPPNSPSTKVGLGKGITGTAYDSFPMVEWHEGKWTLQVWDGTLQQDIQEAKNIVAYLDTHLLPPTYGVFGENIAGDGYHTSVEWVYGNAVYSCFSYHSGLQAAVMAVSARVYPSGQTKP